MPRIAYRILATAAPLWIAAAAASAETCKEQIESFARQHGLTIDAPQARPSEGGPATTKPTTVDPGGGSATDTLRRSGGVIQPPDTGAGRVIAPPPTGDRMATAPDVKPQTPQGQGAGSSQTLAAAERMKLEALTMAGREAAERGQNEECMARLAEARAIAASRAR